MFVVSRKSVRVDAVQAAVAEDPDTPVDPFRHRGDVVHSEPVFGREMPESFPVEHRKPPGARDPNTATAVDNDRRNDRARPLQRYRPLLLRVAENLLQVELHTLPRAVRHLRRTVPRNYAFRNACP